MQYLFFFTLFMYNFSEFHKNYSSCSDLKVLFVAFVVSNAKRTIISLATSVQYYLFQRNRQERSLNDELPREHGVGQHAGAVRPAAAAQDAPYQPYLRAAAGLPSVPGDADGGDAAGPGGAATAPGGGEVHARHRLPHVQPAPEQGQLLRITPLFSGVIVIGKWFPGICKWKNPLTTILVHVLFLILVCYPELILPTMFLYLFMIGVWNYRRRPRKSPHMDTVLSHAEQPHPDELDEEFDSFPTSKPSDIVRMRYDRLRSVAGRVKMVGDLAMQGADPRATAIYITPFQVVAVVAGLYLLRHPRFRSKQPSVPFNFYKRLPAKGDMLL